MHQETIMMFYSDHCFACRQLLQELDRQNVGNKILRVSVDLMRAKGQKVPPQIHSVPALYVLPQKEYLFGKAVFDYLLNLNTGKIRELNKVGHGSGIPAGPPTGDPGAASGAPSGAAGDDAGIQPYTLGTQFSDNFIYLSGDGFADNGNNSQVSYGYASISDNSQMPNPKPDIDTGNGNGMGGKSKMPEFSMDAILSARREEEKSLLGLPVTPGSLPPELQSQKP